jgi:AraC-like DNA-binding protein
VLERDAEMLLIRVPADMIGEYLPRPAAAVRPPPARGGRAGSVRGDHGARHCGTRSSTASSPEYEDCFAHHLLELIGTPMRWPSPAATARRPIRRSLLLIRTHIDDRLYDPASSRRDRRGARFRRPRGRRLFAVGGETSRATTCCAAACRRAARRLRDPRWHGHTIAEIAHCCGFASNAVFTRAFRERHGQSPTEYRALAPARDRRLQRPVSISFDRTGASATLDSGSVGVS